MSHPLNVTQEEAALIKTCIEARFNLSKPGRMTRAQMVMAGKLLGKLEGLVPVQTVMLTPAVADGPPDFQLDKHETFNSTIEGNTVEVEGFKVGDSVVITRKGDFKGASAIVAQIHEDKTVQLRDQAGILYGGTWTLADVKLPGVTQEAEA